MTNHISAIDDSTAFPVFQESQLMFFFLVVINDNTLPGEQYL